MSKRAEELVRKIFAILGGEQSEAEAHESAALIDAELHKERERCAERQCESCRKSNDEYDGLVLPCPCDFKLSILKEPDDV
jgi:hypothetical protein